MSATPPDAARRLALATDPAPSSITRGAVARLHWRHAVTSDPALAAVVDVDSAAPPMSAEWPALLAETHARLLDPAGIVPLPRPSPVGSAVGDALTAHPAWETLCDAAALHPSIARETVVGLADVVRGALTSAKVANTDTRRSLADLDAAREALARARAAHAAAVDAAKKDPGDALKRADEREALRAMVDAGKTEERASGAAQAADAAGARVAADLAGPAAEAVAAIARKTQERAEGMHALMIAGLGDAIGAGDPMATPDDVVELLTPQIARMLRAVGALRLALREGRAARHLPGREGCKGPDVGGLDRVGDLLPLSRAALAGLLGPDLATLERLRLVSGRSAVVEKGGGKANNGHVVVVVDKSGSMRSYGREDWAAALALAILLEARAQHRTCAVVTYDGAVRASIVVDSPVTMREAFAAICKRSGGDNNERAALRAAGECLARMPHGGQSADVVMLTDGQWEASNLTGSGIPAERLRACFIGGSIPPGAKFASAWALRDNSDPADASKLAVEIAATVV